MNRTGSKDKRRDKCLLRGDLRVAQIMNDLRKIAHQGNQHPAAQKINQRTGAQKEKPSPARVIDRRHALAEAATAIEYLETGRARGKVIVVP